MLAIEQIGRVEKNEETIISFVGGVGRHRTGIKGQGICEETSQEERRGGKGEKGK